jgi:hypothetical protein
MKARWARRFAWTPSSRTLVRRRSASNNVQSTTTTVTRMVAKEAKRFEMTERVSGSAAL